MRRRAAEPAVLWLTITAGAFLVMVSYVHNHDVFIPSLAVAVGTMIAAARGWPFPFSVRNSLLSEVEQASQASDPLVALRSLHSLAWELLREAERKPSWMQTGTSFWGHRRKKDARAIYDATRKIVSLNYGDRLSQLPTSDEIDGLMGANAGWPTATQIADAMVGVTNALESIIGAVHGRVPVRRAYHDRPSGGPQLSGFVGSPPPSISNREAESEPPETFRL